MIGGSGVGERPSSLASVESSSTSDSISPSSSNSALFSRGGGGVTRHASIRSTMSEQLDYRSSDQQFLNAGMPNMEVLGSTPEVGVAGKGSILMRSNFVSILTDGSVMFYLNVVYCLLLFVV